MVFTYYNFYKNELHEECCQMNGPYDLTCVFITERIIDILVVHDFCLLYI